MLDGNRHLIFFSEHPPNENPAYALGWRLKNPESKTMCPQWKCPHPTVSSDSELSPVSSMLRLAHSRSRRGRGGRWSRRDGLQVVASDHRGGVAGRVLPGQPPDAQLLDDGRHVTVRHHVHDRPETFPGKETLSVTIGERLYSEWPAFQLFKIP